jgi:phenylacetate-CoA ligase
MEVRIEVTPEHFGDRIRSLEALQRRISASVEHTLGIRAKVSLVEPRTIQRSEGKAKRVVDERKI